MKINDLEAKARQIRRVSLDMALKGGKGHIPPAYSWTEIGVALFYGGILEFDASNPKWPQRSKFILSKGHACLTLYAILADLGFFENSELDNFAGEGAMLAGHPDIDIPGVEVLVVRHGLGVASGFALANQLNTINRHLSFLEMESVTKVLCGRQCLLGKTNWGL